VLTRRARSAFTAIAVALGVGTVITLSVVTHSLKQTAVEILQTGNADFTISQKGVDDVLNSVIDSAELTAIQHVPGVQTAIGTLITTVRLNANNPDFIEIGIPPDGLGPFGVTVIAGRPFGATSTNEIMLGYLAAQNLGLHVGQPMNLGTQHETIVGLFSTNNSIGNSAAMVSLTAMQAAQRESGDVTLVFAKVRPGGNIPAVRAAIEHDFPQLVTEHTESDFGRSDRNLQLLSAADRGATLIALLIGAVVVANTMLLSFFERTREFGLLRAVGWARGRIVVMVIAEALIIGVAGAAIGVALSFAAVRSLQQAPALRGLLHPQYSAGVFWQALYLAAITATLGALYPSVRAAFLVPLDALSHE